MRQTLFFLVLTCLSVLPSALRAQSNDPSDYFLNAYMAFQKGEKAENSGNFRNALASYKQAVSTLDTIAAKWPSWNPPIVKHRRERASEALVRVQPKAGKGGPEPAPEEELTGPLPGTGIDLIPNEVSTPEAAPRVATPRAPVGGGDPIAEIQNRLKALQDDLRSTREKLEKETAEKADYARKYEQAIKASEDSVKRQAIAEGRAQRAEEALMRAEGDGVQNSEKLKALRAEADSAKKTLRDIQIDREAAEELRQQYSDRLNNANIRIAALAQERDLARKESADVPKKIAAMQKELDKVIKEKGDISAKLVKVEGQLKLVTEERDQALAQVTQMKEAQKQVDKLLADNTALMAKLAEAETSITQFKAEGVKKDQEIARLKDDVTSVKKQLASTKKQSDDYQNQMADLQSRLETQGKDLAQVRTEGNVTVTERKKLQSENEILRGIVVRQMKEQARRDQTKKLVLGELAKLEIQSKALISRIDYLGQPVVKLSPKERRLFKDPIIEIGEAEVSIAAPKESEAVAVAETGSTPGPIPPETVASPAADAAPAVAEATPAAPVADDKPAETKTEAESKTEPELPTADPKPMVAEQPAPPPATGEAVTASPPATGEAVPAPPIELAKATPPESLTSLPTTAPDPATTGDSTSGPAVQTSVAPNVPPELIGLAREGKDQFERGNYREAEKLYEKILAKAPNNLYALSNLGVVRFRSGKLKLAEEAFKKAIAVAPEDAFSHCTLGIVFYSQGKYDEAVNELTKALAIQPKNATAHNYLGITASQKGWQEAAQKELETATALDPNYADAFFNLSVVYATQQPPDKEKARKHYKRATELGAEPDSALEQLIK